MRRLTPSIRTQLLFWLVIPILVLLLVGAGLSFGLAMSLATDAYDKALMDSVYTIARCVQRKGDKLTVDVPPATLAMLQDDITDKNFYQVLDQNLHLLAGDPGMPALNLNEDLKNELSACRDGTINGEQIRIASMKAQLPGEPQKFVYIQVGETLHQRERMADQILIGVIFPQFAILGLSALLVWFGVSRGLVPLSKLRDAVASRSPVDLSPLPIADVPKEVRPLVTAINELLERLQQDMQAQRRFIANAAHQLRTPIAGLKTQSELALRQKDTEEIQHALGLIHTGAERAARLANQLLALARTEPGAVDPALWRDVDLNLIGKNACKDFIHDALAKSIDLGFESCDQPAVVVGDGMSLRELISNLIHNAILYTQQGGSVTVRIERSHVAGEEIANLVVEDNGPGIPAEERERVFERFYRLIDKQTAGSGLGLAIVREIAHLHGATVTLGEGPREQGARVTVRFPVSGSKGSAGDARRDTSSGNLLSAGRS
ncbi:MAG TPA: sensor histidine kinase N-terminal domain-containing protein [Planktothrix sp.]|jgi:two-component system sensor histidine kinase TctE